MGNKVIYIMAAVIILLLGLVSYQANTGASKDKKLKEREAELAQKTQIINELSGKIDKFNEYLECISKTLIAPADEKKAIEGSINDPVTALENCRIQVDGVIVSEGTFPTPGSTREPSPARRESPTPQPTRQTPTTQTTPGNNQQEDPSSPEPNLVEQTLPIVCPVPILGRLC